MRILLADTETTDVDEAAEICELAFIEVDENLNEILRYTSLVNPKGLISPAAAGASGITNRMTEGAPTIEEVMEFLHKELGEDYFTDVVLVAHNCKFDKRLLEPYWAIAEGLCTLRASQHWFPESPNHRLQTLRHYLEIDIDADMHRAEADVEVMKELLVRLIETSGVGDLRGLIEFESIPRVIEAMPWGKHKGVALSALPWGYRKWLLALPDLDNDLRNSLEALG